jgi:apolipoprotein N-acyltransferase
MGNLYWIYFVIQHYSNVPPLLCVGILMLLCIVMALFWGIFLFLSGIFRDRAGLEMALLTAPFVWTLLERARSYTTQFPWCLFGYSQFNHLRIAQLASFTGVYGLSWILVAFNASVVMIIILRKKYYTIAITSVLVVIVVYGNFRIQRSVGENTAQIGLIQGNVPQDVKLNYKFGESIHRRHIDMSKDLLRKSKLDILFWSEAATLFPLRDGGIWTEQIRGLAASNHTPIILGSDTFQGKEIFNSAYLVNEKGEIEAQYDKVYLVPFGEFVPLKKIFFFAGKMVPEISDFTHGTNFEPFVIHGQKISINICFEVVFPQLSRKFFRSNTSSYNYE